MDGTLDGLVRSGDTPREGRRTAYEHLDLIALLGRRDVRLDKLSTYVPRCAIPARGWGFIERMHDFELVRMRALQRGELVAEQDVRFGHIGVQQREARPVRGFVEGVLEELVQGRDTRSSADERHVLKFIRYAADGRRGQVA